MPSPTSSSDEPSLSAWYADPLGVEQAEQLLLDVRNKLGRARGSHYLQLRLQEIIARYWLGRDISTDIENLQTTCKDDYCRALIKLVYGQLLICRKQQGALDYLQQGFRQGANLFTAVEYLEVMRRHERLKHLVLSEQAAEGRSLEDLLKEADVIKELQGKANYHCDVRGDREDTVG
jgi:hypothetical protein